MLPVSVPWVVLVLTLVLFRFIGCGESVACFGTGSEAVPWGHVNGPSERRIRPAFLQPRALDGTALTIEPSKNCPVTAIYWAGVGQWRHSRRSASVHRHPTLKADAHANCAIWVVAQVASPTSATRGGELGVLRVREHPLNMEVHPLTAKSTPSKWKKNLMKCRFKQTSNKIMVVLTFILGLYLYKTAVINHLALNWTATSGKAPPRVSTILHLCRRPRGNSLC